MMALALMIVSVVLVLGGLRLIWRDEPDKPADKPIDPPGRAGRLQEGLSAGLDHEVHTMAN